MSWRYGLNLSCGHEIDLGQAEYTNVAFDNLDHLPERKDGWYAAYPCPTCRRRRAVTSSFTKYEADE